MKSKQPVKDDGSCDYGDDKDNSKMVPTQQIVELSISDEGEPLKRISSNCIYSDLSLRSFDVHAGFGQRS